MPGQPYSIEPYSGNWGRFETAHLLRRTTFGPTPQEIDELAAGDIESSLDTILAGLPPAPPPVNTYYENDPQVPIGETWVNANGSINPEIVIYRGVTLSSWTIDRMLLDRMNIREKMVMFWHNHFVVSDLTDMRYLYKHVDLFRSDPLGNFRTLTKQITIDPAMLRYLNGNQNRKESPNENYARELLELFTIGKGPLAGPGDYTNYTEGDIQEISKILTGWVDIGYHNFLNNTVDSQFRPFRHDTSTKQLSHRFDSAIISNAGADEYFNLIDIIFEQPEVARNISRDIYRWFVHYKIDDNVESGIIEPMAQTLIDNDYNILPAVRQLLTSEHFYSEEVVGCMVKNPLDFLVGVLSTNYVNVPQSPSDRTFILNILYGFAGQMEMEYYNIPQVAGWEAYYQTPRWYRTWINSSTLSRRLDYTNLLAITGVPYNNSVIRMDHLTFISQFNDPFDPNSLIREWTELVFPYEVTESQLDQLKEVLIPGLPDFEWTTEYAEYLNDPGNQQLKAAVDAKLSRLAATIMSMSEYHLM